MGTIRRLRLLGNIIAVLGIVIIFFSTLLPIVKMPQTLIVTGPNIPLTAKSTYWIDTFIIPTIDNDTIFSVTLRGNQNGGLGVTIIPYSNGAPLVGAMPLINYMLTPSQNTFTTQVRTTVQAEYFVSVYSQLNNYTLTINSVWSPYNSFRPYLYLGLSMLPAGLLIIYYDRIVEKKEQIIQNSTAQ